MRTWPVGVVAGCAQQSESVGAPLPTPLRDCEGRWSTGVVGAHVDRWEQWCLTRPSTSRHVFVSALPGGSKSLDFALSFPARLYSLIFASGTGGIRDADYREAMERFRPPGVEELPPHIRELSEAYRDANPEGLARWRELTEGAVTGNRMGQTNLNRIEWAALEGMEAPTLLIIGEADRVMPPELFPMIASHLPNAELAVVPEAGHMVFWEQPEAFNQLVLDFLSRHSR